MGFPFSISSCHWSKNNQEQNGIETSFFFFLFLFSIVSPIKVMLSFENNSGKKEKIKLGENPVPGRGFRERDCVTYK